MAKHDLLQRETLKRQVQALRISLAEASSSPIENLLIDVVISTFRAFKQAELSAAAAPSAFNQAQEHHVTQTPKRYISALKELGRMRQLLTHAHRLSCILRDDRCGKTRYEPFYFGWHARRC